MNTQASSSLEIRTSGTQRKTNMITEQGQWAVYRLPELVESVR
jgi:hypothetical protein